jgi:hypothetical protein
MLIDLLDIPKAKIDAAGPQFVQPFRAQFIAPSLGDSRIRLAHALLHPQVPADQGCQAAKPSCQFLSMFQVAYPTNASITYVLLMC